MNGHKRGQKAFSDLNNESRIIPGLASVFPGYLGFDDDPPAMRPFLGCVEGVTEDIFGRSGGTGFYARLPHQPASALEQPGVARHPENVFDLFHFEVVEKLGVGKPAVKTNPDLGFRETGFQHRHDSHLIGSRSRRSF